MNIREEVKKINEKCDDCIDALDLEKSDEEVLEALSKLVLQMKTMLMKDDGTIN